MVVLNPEILFLRVTIKIFFKGILSMNFEKFEKVEYKHDFYKEITQDTQRRKISERFDVLAQRKDNWDGYESKKPSQSTLNHAKFLIEELLDSIISAGHPWLMPFISSDEDGYVTAAWHKGERELHLEIEENEVEYTRIWGSNHDMKMEIASLNPDNSLTLWEWLIDEQ